MQYLLLSSLALVLLSCTPQPQQKIIETWEDGSKKVVVTYANPNDTTTYHREFYHPNGVLGTMGNYVRGKQDGRWEWWFDNGNRNDLAYLTSGGYFGYRIHWYENGNVEKIEELVDTLPSGNGGCGDGRFFLFNEDGTPDEVFTMVNGEFEGRTLHYDSLDRSEIQIYFKHGIKDGAYREVYTNGKIKVNGYYLNGKQAGSWRWFDRSGKEIARATF